MYKIIKISMLLGGILMCFSLNTYAQEKGIWTNLEYVSHYNAWLSSNNAVGLKYTPINKISEVSVSGMYNSGDFINYNESNQSTDYSFKGETYYRYSDDVVFYGNISYNSFEGKNMGASAWIDPYFAPFNIVEYVDTCRGEKVMETYNLIGATSIDLNEKITIGGKINYTSANYVKHKDLRHLNELMNLELSVGAMYRIGKIADLGINYNYRKRVEETNFDTYGNTDSNYSSLISWGVFWGKVETFGSEGFTGENDNNPLIDKINGASIQLNLYLSKRLQFFNEFTYNKRKGYFGVETNQTVVYTRHNSKNFEYTGNLSYATPKLLHRLNIHLLKDNLENYKTNYYYDNNIETGTQYVKYNTSTKVLDRENVQIQGKYQLDIDYNNLNPKWSFIAAGEYNKREQNVLVYPLYRNQTINQIVGSLSINRNITSGRNQYSIALAGAYSSGGGTMLDEGSYSNSNDNTTTLRSTDFYLYREYEYLTSNKLSSKLGFTYSRLFKQNKIRAFVSAQYEFTKANDVVYLTGNTFNSTRFTIGCAF